MICGGQQLEEGAPRTRGTPKALNRPQPISAPQIEVQDGLPNPQRMLAFTTLAMAISMAVLDGTIVTVALPTMARQFSVAPENAIWIVNAFQLAVTVSLLPLAALGDMLGYRRVYWWGLPRQAEGSVLGGSRQSCPCARGARPSRRRPP